MEIFLNCNFVLTFATNIDEIRFSTSSAFGLATTLTPTEKQEQELFEQVNTNTTKNKHTCVYTHAHTNVNLLLRQGFHAHEKMRILLRGTKSSGPSQKRKLAGRTDKRAGVSERIEWAL